tara:strand:+ start:4282 stop:4494 length:213 start_codon:yes stop_codon:yes gene_type:complete
MTKSYAEYRRSRMQDCIEDYFQSDDVDARYAYEEILLVIQELADYHEMHRARYLALKDYMLGYNPIPERF